ncbi:Chloramphenicol efflux pump OS=Streptomyces antimycoticus OX=68175 GN=SSPO_056450 PE=4 SV=1 [Streptomyces antimycoticus]
MLGGRIADAHLFGTMLGGITASTVVLSALALTAHSAVAAVTLALLLGFTAFFTAPALNARMFNLANAAPTLAGATNTSAFNIGNTVGPWLGGLVIDLGWGYPAVAWTGAALAGTGVVTTVAAMRLHRAAGGSRVIATSAAYDLADAEAAPDPSRTTH